MLSPYSHHFSSPLLPDTLQHLLCDRAPANKIGVAMTDTLAPKNGRDLTIEKRWLTDKERRQLEHYSFDKRRTEWLAGRVCAKQAALELLNGRDAGRVLHPLDIVIETSPGGRPYLRAKSGINDIGGIDISISHSHDMAVSIAGYGMCGVDIQLLNSTLFKVRQKYCADSEVVVLDDISDDQLLQLGLLWVGKEAVRKCLSSVRLLGFTEIQLEGSTLEQGYHVLRFRLDEPFSDLGSVAVTAHAFGSYALAVCTLQPVRLDA